MIRKLYRRLCSDLRLSSPDSEHPRRTFWTGAAFGALSFVLLLWAIAGYHFNTGLSPVLMLLIGLVAGIVTYALFAVGSLLLAYGSRALPNFFFAAIGGAIGALIVVRFAGFRWPVSLYYPAAFIYLWINALLFGSLWRWIALPQRRHWSLTAVMILAVLLNGYGIYWLVQDGSYPSQPPSAREVAVTTLSETGLPSPAQAGDYLFDYFTYGSGTDKHRPEYGIEVRFKTPSVDAGRLLPEWKGSKKKWRERYWGFGANNFPLNGRVWLPQGEGPFPIALIVHGNHGMEDYSDGGYAYLGELLAGRGYLAVSVDENFINGTWSGDFRGREMPTRAWLLLKHLQQWRTWDETSGHELAGKADLDQVLLIGHSRGGEAVAIAAAFNELGHFPDDANETFDFGFGIQGLVAIAPTDKRYQRRIELVNINYLSLQGSYDSDEASFFGWRQAQRITFTDSSYHFKAGLYIHRANHGQFNTSWGRTDSGAPFSWLLNLEPLIAPEDQQRIAQVYISAFADAVFKEDRRYLPMFREAAAARDWLPDTRYINTFRDSRNKVLVDFEEDIDVTTGKEGIALTGRNFKIWKEEELQFRDKDTQGNNALILGWDYPKDAPADSIPEYSITLPELSSFLPGSTTHFLISLAPGDPKGLREEGKGNKEKGKEEKDSLPPDFSIVLEDYQGRRCRLSVSDFESLPPRLQVQYLKKKSLSRSIWGSPWEVTLESYAIPLDRFEVEDGDFDITKLRTIRLRCNQTEKGVIVVDDIGYGTAAPIE